MRPSLWLILILAFSVGMGCALVIRALHFEAPVVAKQNDEPKTKILVATRTIPDGVEITADFVAFQEVPLSEVPLVALSSFTQVYRRQSAYPIPADCPICEDLLLPPIDATSSAAFIPAGSQLVSLDIVHIRQGDKVFPPREPISTILEAGQRIDIRIVPRNEGHGRLAEMKNEVLRNYAAQDPRNSGELLLANVPIHEIQRRSVIDHTSSLHDSLILMLDKNAAAKLMAAAKKGQIRILAHQNEQTSPQSIEVETIIKVAEQGQPQDTPLDIPVTLEQPSLVPAESAPIMALEHVQKDAPMPDADCVHPDVAGGPHSLDRLGSPPVFTSSEHGDVEKVLIRNESSTASFGASPRIISSDRPAEETSVLTGLPQTNVPEREALTHPLSETIMGTPRGNQAIKFLPPGTVASVTEYLPAMASRSESVVTLPTTIPPAATLPVMPLIVPPPNMLPIRTDVPPGYTPFERRIYTVQPSEGWDDLDGVPTPPRLMKSYNTAPL